MIFRRTLLASPTGPDAFERHLGALGAGMMLDARCNEYHTGSIEKFRTLTCVAASASSLCLMGWLQAVPPNDGKGPVLVLETACWETA